MIQKRIPQEWLKVIACVSMLTDHAAYVFGWALKWRAVGRLAFPIFCFLLAEGAFHTRNPKKYALRLAIAAVISEFAFDFAFFGRLYWEHQNVMLTMLLGILALETMKGCSDLSRKFLVSVPFAVIADLLSTDYSGYGVMLIALFGAARDLPRKWLWIGAGMAVLFWLMPGARVNILGIYVPVQMFGLASLGPIALYSGEKLTRCKAAQWAFYLFYPVHMVILRLIWVIL